MRNPTQSPPRVPTAPVSRPFTRNMSQYIRTCVDGHDMCLRKLSRVAMAVSILRKVSMLGPCVVAYLQNIDEETAARYVTFWCRAGREEGMRILEAPDNEATFIIAEWHDDWLRQFKEMEKRVLRSARGVVELVASVAERSGMATSDRVRAQMLTLEAMASAQEVRALFGGAESGPGLEEKLGHEPKQEAVLGQEMVVPGPTGKAAPGQE